MKKFASVFLILFFSGCIFGQTFYGTTDVKLFREGRNNEMRNKDETALLDEDFPRFKGLINFRYDPKYRVEAIFEPIETQKSIILMTSSGKSKKGSIVGYIKFQLNRVPLKLAVYQLESVAQNDEYKDLLFIPFKDLTNGKETYSGGRYIDIWKPKINKVIIDFNLAYNPSCAYGSSRFNCPIPPKENFLQVKINVGEKNYVSPKSGSNH